MGQSGDLPGAVLFACSRNAVRSPMAAAILKHLAGKRIYVDSAGVRPGEPDPFAIAVMEEMGVDMSRHRPVSIGSARSQLRSHRHARGGSPAQGPRARLPLRR